MTFRLTEDRLQREHVEVPGSVIDVQSMIDEVGAIAEVAFGSDDIGKMY